MCVCGYNMIASYGNSIIIVLHSNSNHAGDMESIRVAIQCQVLVLYNNVLLGKKIIFP